VGHKDFTEMFMPRSRSYKDKLIKALKDPEEATAYLNAVFEGAICCNNPLEKELAILAFQNVSDAQGWNLTYNTAESLAELASLVNPGGTCT
jgi:hypothetical protein